MVLIKFQWRIFSIFLFVQLSPWRWRRWCLRWWREKELERPKRAGGDPRKEAEREGEDSQQRCTRGLGCLPSKTRPRVSLLDYENFCLKLERCTVGLQSETEMSLIRPSPYLTLTKSYIVPMMMRL